MKRKITFSDHADFAPRVGIAWGLGKGKNTKTVLRAGFGVFYDRFGESYILNAERLNGINQQQYIVPSPDFFPNIPPVSDALGEPDTPTIYQIAPNLRTPYTTQSGIGLERQVTKSVTVSVTYLNTHGVHQLITRDINAPYPANPGDARPNPNLANLYQYESAGLYNQNQMIANFNHSSFQVFASWAFTLSAMPIATRTADFLHEPVRFGARITGAPRTMCATASSWAAVGICRADSSSFPLSWPIPPRPSTSLWART